MYKEFSLKEEREKRKEHAAYPLLTPLPLTTYFPRVTFLSYKIEVYFIQKIYIFYK